MGSETTKRNYKARDSPARAGGGRVLAGQGKQLKETTRPYIHRYIVTRESPLWQEAKQLKETTSIV